MVEKRVCGSFVGGEAGLGGCVVGGWIGVEDSERRTDVRGRREGEWPRASPMLGNMTAAPVGSREPVPLSALVCCLPTGAARKRGG